MPWKADLGRMVIQFDGDAIDIIRSELVSLERVKKDLSVTSCLLGLGEVVLEKQAVGKDNIYF